MRAAEASAGAVVPPHRQAMVALAATLLYVASTTKYQARDPLSTQAGIQAVLEIGLVMGALGLSALITRPRTLVRHLTPTVIGFILFAVFAMLSSAFSFWPPLSLIKASLLVATVLTAAMLCAARPPKEVVTAVYWAVIALIVVGTMVKFASAQPLFDTDEYSGRARFTLFALHWGSLADFVAYTFLLGRLLPRRPPAICQALLVVVNLAAGARASTIALLLVALFEWGWRQRVSMTALTVGSFSVAAAALVAFLWVNGALPTPNVPYERLYGDKVTVDEIVTLNNRTALWAESFRLVPGTLLFGYGLEGMRAVLLQEFEWAGHSHNAYLELLFAGGLAGLVSFLGAWGSAVRAGWRATSETRLSIIGLHVYMFICGLTDPNLTLLMFFPMFVIVCLDAVARADIAASVADKGYRTAMAGFLPALGQGPLPARPVGWRIT